MANRPDHIDLESGPRVDWGDALSVPVFYGREEEQALLSRWVVGERCRVVSVLGMGGIGKSALVMNVTLQLMMHFEVVIVRSLRDAPSCEALLDDCLRVLSSQEGGAVGNVGSSWESVGAGLAPDSILQFPDSCALWEPLRQESLEQRISLLLSHLRKVRALVVLDNLEGLLEARDVKGHLRPSFEGYGQLLLRVAETGHRSCLLLTSREKPAELRLLEGRYPLVHSLRLVGLDIAACKRLLEEKEVVGTSSEQERLIGIYAGNPLALKIVAQAIVDVFSCKIGPFLAGDMVIFSSITDLLDEQFARLSAQEQSVLYWLAIMREPVTFDELHEMLVIPQPRVQLLEAVDASYRRSLIERGKRPGSFTLQSVVLEYVTMLLIAEAASEIQQCRLNKLIQYSLELAHAKEYVRQTQQRLLVGQLLADLQSKYPRRADRTKQEPRTVPTAPLEEQLLSLLNDLREENYNAQGYGPTNLIALLRAQRKHLSGLNLSQLSIRGAYLQSIQMQDTSLVGSLIRDTVFTEAVSVTWAVTISLDGKWWAASGMQGNVRLWDEGGQTLQRIWRAHTDMVKTLAFSPDGRTLASGSLDGTIKLWDVETGALLWTSWQNGPQCLAFSPDGSLLASCGRDATVRLWGTNSHGTSPCGTNLQTLTHPGPVFAVAWSSDGNLLASSCFDGEIRLWERQKTAPATGVEILLLQTSWVTGPVAHLAFAPDGKALACANWDRTVKLWEVPTGCLLHTLPGQTDQTNSVIWSPDGRLLASGSYGKAIWLWDVKQGQRQAVLLGHTANINGMAFTPDSSRLLSGSVDSTLRVWDVENCQCVRVIAGYAVSLYDIDWSPDGTHLVSGGTDALVTIWDLSGEWDGVPMGGLWPVADGT
jgi:WD40 repeat protein